MIDIEVLKIYFYFVFIENTKLGNNKIPII